MAHPHRGILVANEPTLDYLGMVMSHFYLNTYAPLVISRAGRLAAQEHGIPPFVDGSIRREPDLEHVYPAISCLCRGGKFAPRLEVGDIVAYMTRKGSYGTGEVQRRLTALLRVIEVSQSHATAARWYQDRDLPLPSNCWVRGNPPKPFEQSHRRYRSSKCLGQQRTYREWDASYRLRSQQFGTFVVCQPWFRDLTWNAPVVTDAQLRRAFGAIPGTQNPKKMPLEAGDRFLAVLAIDVSPCLR